MAELVDGRQRRNARVWARVVFGLLGLSALGLGAWGLWLHVQPSAGLDPLHRYLDLAYYDLQLLVLSSSPLQGGPYPWQLEVARFAAPAATVYALSDAVLVLFSERLASRSLRHRKGHAIVIGDTAAAHAIVRGLQITGQTNVVLARDGDPQSLRAHGIDGAAALYACQSEDSDRGINVATVLAAAALRPQGGVRAYAQVTDPDLALTLRARRLGLPSADKTRLDFFNVEEVAARLVIEAADFTMDAPQILISGLGTFGKAILVEYARHWRLRSPWRERRADVTVVDPRASDIITKLRSQWTLIDQVCDIRIVDGGVDQALTAGMAARTTTTYICEEDEQLALRTALSAAELWHGGPRSLVVRLNIMSRLGTAFHGDGRQGPNMRLLDDLGGRLLLVGVTEVAADTVGMIQQDLVERLAQAIHEQYLLSELDSGKQLGSTPTLALWNDLSEDTKNANRAQAGDIGEKLRRIGCTVAPHQVTEPPFAFTDAEVDTLAEYEHERWHAERYAAGWRHAERRDDKKKLHTAMIAWRELTEAYRDIDRHAVRVLPIVLADVGLRIVRLTNQPALPQRSGAHDMAR